MAAAFTLSALAAPASTPAASSATSAPQDLTALGLEELMHVKITSASKKSQSLREAPAAIYVLTAADIRRSGALGVPDALRLVPGIQVAQIDQNKWAISARGFNGRFANKLLVLIDGRTVYTPLFSGVLWDVQTPMLDDIDRIEVVRGPGGTLWGSNAVNGVINIITKKASRTQGGLAVGALGSPERSFDRVRYGGQVSDKIFYRVYGQLFDLDAGTISAATGAPSHDPYSYSQAGFRFDDESKARRTFTLQGDVYNGKSGGLVGLATLGPGAPLVDNSTPTSGGNVMLKADRRYGGDAELSAQLYADATHRDDPQFYQSLNTLDGEVQYRFHAGEDHELVTGLGMRFLSDRNDALMPLVFVTPVARNTHIYNAFAQDEYRLEPDLRLTLGAKLEHNSYTGLELQPNARLLWLPDEKQAVWAAVSRAVRTPSRVERDGRVNSEAVFARAGVPAIVALFGSRTQDSEELLARELGWRIDASRRLSLDATGFLNSYDDLRTLEPGAPRPEPLPTPHLLVPLTAANKAAAETYGFELAMDWRAAERWRLRAGYTFLHIDLTRQAGSLDTSERLEAGQSPNHQLFLASTVELTSRLELNSDLRYVDKLASLNVPSYFTLDLRLGWRATDNLELSVAGRDLLDSRHQEFVPTLLTSETTLVERSFYGQATWRF